jgi:peptidoglycan/xylan/chitin deacetylase (PgdA/CDA1 family)
MRLDFDASLAQAGRYAPTSVLRASLRAALAGLRIALVFHRVRPPRRTHWAEGMAICEADLDATVDMLLDSRPGVPRGWLTLTFDDGYEDAAAYVASRAHRYPDVEFIFFVCPEKIEVGAGFRWDLAELLRREGASFDHANRVLEAPLDVAAENAREDLRRVAAHPDFRLARSERILALGQIPNVSLGNHTNCHFEWCRLDRAQAQRELERSVATFQRLFGEQRHLALPFGDGLFDEAHLSLVRTQNDYLVWGTGQSPYRPAERFPGAFVPRFVVDGRWGVRGTAAAIAGHCMAMRTPGVRRLARLRHSRIARSRARKSAG